MFLSILLVGATLASRVTSSYVLQDNYTPSSFFDKFSFFTAGDPTNGYVNYIDQPTAQNSGLIGVNNNQIYIGVDHANVASGRGRDSVRIVSSDVYNHGLFILDLAHMPGGICGTWPAFWMVGPNWPNDGEIDIIEGVHTSSNNAMTLHTSDGCSITNDGAFSGVLTTPNCYIYANNQVNNAGCDIQDQRTNSYGTSFNSIGGGVFATEWTSSDINIWFFPRSSIPTDVSSGNPDPTSWGEPVAQFQGACEIDAHFQNQQIVFDDTFCGDWAGNVWSSTTSCASLAASCQDYVQNNPSAFTDAYWLINSLQVYQANGAVARVKANAAFRHAPANATAPLNSAPLAMGGGLPPKGRFSRRFNNWAV